MTLASYLTSQFSLAQTMDFFIRIVVACICGFILGIERSRRFKEAGVRTHMIVCCGAALVMILSKYGFADLVSEDGAVFNGVRGADPARLAAQVVSGISFLGAGMIFKSGTNIKGLTTAAGIWAAAGIGLAIGAGMYAVGIFTTVIIAFLQILMHLVPVGSDSYHSSNLEFLVEDTPDFHQVYNRMLKDLGAQVVECRITKNENLLRYNITLKSKKKISSEDVTLFFAEHEEVKEISVISL